MERRKKCIDPKAGDAGLWIKIWEELHRLAARDIVVEVGHIKAHRPNTISGQKLGKNDMVWSGMRRIPPKSPPGFDKRNKRSGGILGKSETKWEMDATSLHDDVLLDTEECYK